MRVPGMGQKLQRGDFAGAGQAQHGIEEPQRQRDQRHRGDALAPEMAGAGMGRAHALNLVQRGLRGVHCRYPAWPVQPSAKIANAPIRTKAPRSITLLRSASVLVEAIAQIPGQMPHAVEEVIDQRPGEAEQHQQARAACRQTA